MCALSCLHSIPLSMASIYPFISLALKSLASRTGLSSFPGSRFPWLLMAALHPFPHIPHVSLASPKAEGTWDFTELPAPSLTCPIWARKWCLYHSSLLTVVLQFWHGLWVSGDPSPRALGAMHLLGHPTNSAGDLDKGILHLDKVFLCLSLCAVHCWLYLRWNLSNRTRPQSYPTQWVFGEIWALSLGTPGSCCWLPFAGKFRDIPSRLLPLICSLSSSVSTFQVPKMLLWWLLAHTSFPKGQWCA